MHAVDRPRLRRTITGKPDPRNADLFWLFDGSHLSTFELVMPRSWVQVLPLYNGENTYADMQAWVMRTCGGQFLPEQFFRDIAGKLDEGLMLDTPRWRERRAELVQEPIREPACIGCYHGEPNPLRQQLDGLFTHPQGPGLPAREPADGTLRGALVPHIDFQRGGPSYGWAFKEIVERSDASVFVIIGTSHHSGERFTVTRKNFRTPLGVVETDQTFVGRLAEAYGDRLFADELEAHHREHSIEFQVLLLQHCLGASRPFRIVPMVVGSFHDCIECDLPPHEREDIYLMIQSLRKVDAECGEKVCYIVSGDLAHIGPKFGADRPLDVPTLDWSRRQDHALLQQAELADRDGFFQVILNEKDQRHTCGFPPLYTMLAVVRPTRGKVLHYDQYVEPNGHESVSFASVGFYGP